MWPLKKKKSKSKKTDEHFSLKNQALLKLKGLDGMKGLERRLSELSKIYKIFLEKRLKLKKGSTHEEISEEVKKKKIDRKLKIRIIYLSAQFNSLQYGDEKVSQTRFKEMIENFKEIINLC